MNKEITNQYGNENEKGFIGQIVGVAFGVVVLGLVFLLMPDVALPSNVENAIKWGVQVLVNFDFIIPVETLLTIFALILLIEVVLLTIRSIVWVGGVLVKKS